MRTSAPKSVRFGLEELRRLERLRRFFPEATNEADLIRIAFQRGLILMEAEVAGAGGGVADGLTEEQLAVIALPRMFSALNWLGRLGYLPHLAMAPPMSAPTRIADSVEPNVDTLAFDPAAADDIGGLGGDFLGAWDD